MKIEITPEMQQIAAFFADMRPAAVDADRPALFYFVGGCVRDVLLGIVPHDYDIATNVEPPEIVAHAKARGRKANTVGASFGTVKVKVPVNNGFQVVDVTTFRGDTYNGEGRKPIVTYGHDVVEDLGRRDFTINAIAARTNGQLVDPFGGLADIENHTLRTVGNPKTRFREDPLRILRGIRLAAKYDLQIEAKTADRMTKMRWELLRLSKERITEEIDKMFNLRSGDGAAGRALMMLFEFQAWQMICPPLQRQFGFEQQNPHHRFPLHVHSIMTAVGAVNASQMTHDLDGSTASCRFECTARAGWTGLLHDIAKPDTQTLHKSGERFNYIGHEILGAEIVDGWARQNKWSNHRREYVVDTIRHHLEPDNWLRVFDQAAKSPTQQPGEQL